jgi:hypothetical protein
MIYTDPFDEEMANLGPAAIFTLTHEMELQVDVFRTRELRRQNTPPFTFEQCHCVLIDHKTKWPQYVLITSAALCVNHERATIVRFNSFEEAIEAMDSMKSEYYVSVR